MRFISANDTIPPVAAAPRNMYKQPPAVHRGLF